MAKVNSIPEGYHTVTPYLIIKDAKKAIEFYKKAFGAVANVPPFIDPQGKVGHAELQIGDSKIMLSDEFLDRNVISPQTLKGSPIKMHLYVEDVDARFKQAVDAGAKVMMPLEDRFYGDRNGQIQDPFGHIWMLSTHKEDVSFDEMKKRLAALYEKK